MVDGPPHGVRAVLVLVNGHSHGSDARAGGVVVRRQLGRGHLADRRAWDGAGAGAAPATAAVVVPISLTGARAGNAPGVAADATVAPSRELVWEKRLINEVKAHCSGGLRVSCVSFLSGTQTILTNFYLICPKFARQALNLFSAI